MNKQFLHNKHLAARAGFGLSYDQVKLLATESCENFYNILKSGRGFEEISVIDSNYSIYKSLNKDRKKLNDFNRKKNLELIHSWQDKMVNNSSQLFEKMVFFWHGHFATRVKNVFFNEQILNVFRRNALGNFRDLLFETAQSPAMLSFLNNQQNKKEKPNENFARELMELFTLGRGNYTEKDIKEAARAFTGWGYNGNAKFRVREEDHDFGRKTFLGREGNLTGADIINTILDKPECADFIAGKLYKFFVNEEPDELIIRELGRKFYQSNYDILTLLDSIFLAEWFYSEKNIGAKIKSPVELFVGMRRVLPMNILDIKSFYLIQEALGQRLLSPPNVAGWPSGLAWIDSSTLLFRLNLPEILADTKDFSIEPRQDDDVSMGKKEKEIRVTTGKKLTAVDWEAAASILKEDLPEILLSNPQIMDEHNLGLINGEKDDKQRLVMIMSTPEYQLA